MIQKLWAVKILKSKQNLIWAFPYYVPEPSYPPYPGFDILEAWLQENYTGYTTERLYNDGAPVLEIVFKTIEDAFMFVLSADQQK